MNKFYIISIIFSVYIIIFVVTSFFVYDKMNYKDIRVDEISKETCAYRLGDIILHKFHRDKNSGKLCHIKIYPDSIASEYLQKTNKTKDINTLYEIIKKRSEHFTLLPSNNELIVHVRVGDVIDRQNASVDNMLSQYYYHTNYFFYKLNYVKPYSFYENIITKLPKNINTINLVYGYHCKGNHSKSIDYIHKIKTLFNRYGYNVNLRSNNNPDDDFIFMSNSKYFAQSGGGYSKLISSLVKRGGNVVYEDKQSNFNFPVIVTIILILIIIPIYVVFK